MYQTVTEVCIADMVNTFYGQVRTDALLGPVFTKAIGDDWTAHLEKMNAFWSTVLLATRTYKGNPMMAHLQLPRLTQEHFERWLGLWRETAARLCSERVASLFVQKAEMIAERFLYAITMHHEALSRQDYGTAAQAL